MTDKGSRITHGHNEQFKASQQVTVWVRTSKALVNFNIRDKNTLCLSLGAMKSKSATALANMQLNLLDPDKLMSIFKAL